MHELSQSEKATITEQLNVLAPSVLGGVDRTAKIDIVGDVGVLRLVVAMRNEQATLAEHVPPDDETVGVRVDIATALAIGSGATLLEDAYGAGAIVVERASPADFSLAPLLEVLFDALVQVGVIGADNRAG